MPAKPRKPAPAEFISLAEAATQLAVSERTLRRRVADGSLPAERLQNSRLIRVRRSDVDALLRPIPSGAI